jgi:aryl-alcohol dehydrogenase-like predicted oxidoreductase
MLVQARGLHPAGPTFCPRPHASVVPMPIPLSDYRLFGRTGVKVSPLGLGCMMFGRRTELRESARIIDRAIASGINFLDTSNSYSHGLSEEHVGESLKRNGKRDRVFLASKVHLPSDDTDPNAQGISRRHIVAAAEASLKRLRTDRLDLFQIPRPHPEVAIDEVLRALDDLVRAGKVLYTGTSNFAGWQVVESLWVSKELGLNHFVSEQPPYNLLDRRIERELLPVAQTYGLAIIPWSPIGGGLLTGKYQRGETPPTDARYAAPSPMAEKRFTQRVFDVIEPMKEFVLQKNAPLSQIALAWVTRQPGVTAPIIGPRTIEQLDDALRSLEITFTPEELRRIDEIIPPGTHVSDFYSADHGPSRFRW